MPTRVSKPVAVHTAGTFRIVKDLERRLGLEPSKICFAGRRLDRFGIQRLVPGPRFELGISSF